MIKTQLLVPEVYYNRSRDFQLLGRLYEFVFNYIKTNSDMLEHLPYSDIGDSAFIDLCITSLGFNLKHTYNDAQLKGLCSIFITCIRNKGNILSLTYALNMLGRIENIDAKIYAEIYKKTPTVVYIYLPNQLKNIILLEDVLSYILPAGMSYRLVRHALIPESITTTLYEEDTLKVSHPADPTDPESTDKYYWASNDISTIYDISKVHGAVRIDDKDVPAPMDSEVNPGIFDNSTVTGEYPELEKVKQKK